MRFPNPLHVIARLTMVHDYRLLAKRCRYQQEAFCALQDQFASHAAALQGCDVERFITHVWGGFNARLARSLLPRPPFGFLNDPIVMKTMFVTADGRWLLHELTALEALLPPAQLRALLLEDAVGRPLLAHTRYQTSRNSIRHLFHLVRFAEATGCPLRKLSMVVEWGGGYGNMAKVFHRYHGGQHTYVIVDLPLLSCLQWLYLGTIFGSADVVLMLDSGETIQSGKINLVPVCFLDRIPHSAELFVSTWGLSESSAAAIDEVSDREWFGSRHLLLAYQRRSRVFPDAERVGDLAVRRGALVELLPDKKSFYAFL